MTHSALSVQCCPRAFGNIITICHVFISVLFNGTDANQIIVPKSKEIMSR
jgi:hypothetical protein